MGRHVRQLQGAAAPRSLKEAQDKGTDVYDQGSVHKTQTRSQVRYGYFGRRAETHRAKMVVGPVTSNERCVLPRVTNECLFLGSVTVAASHLTAFLGCQSWETLS